MIAIITGRDVTIYFFSKFHHQYAVARKLWYNYYDIAHVYLHAYPSIIIRHISQETRELFTSVVDKIQLKMRRALLMFLYLLKKNYTNNR